MAWSRLPTGWRIEEYTEWSGTGLGDDRLALGLYRWQTSVTKRLFRKPVTQPASWVRVKSGRSYSLAEIDRAMLTEYANDTMVAEAMERKSA